MSGVRPRMTHLFEQLGLDASEAAIQQFIETHQLNAETTIAEAEFWTEAQRQFIVEKIQSDGLKSASRISKEQKNFMKNFLDGNFPYHNLQIQFIGIFIRETIL